MKNSLMVKASVLSALLALVTLAGRSAIAGYHYGSDVVIDRSVSMAKGSLGRVHNSTDGVQQIGCSLRSSAGAKSSVWCYAMTTTGESAECTSNDPGIVQMAGMINPSSTIYFYWNASKVCTALNVDNFSSNTVPQP